MKCPNCGLEIPEGHMYCDNCGTEINFVPDFEPEVENEINASLFGMAEELNKEERLRKERIEKRKAFFQKIKSRWLFVVVAVMTLVLAGVFLNIYFMYSNKTAFYYLSLADNERNKGNIKTAIEYLKEGSKEHPENSDIIFRLSDCYLELGMEDEAVESLMTISSSALFPEEKVLNAYERIISIYKQSGDTEKLSEFLSSEDDELIRELKSRYIPNMPSMKPASGAYDVVNVSLKMLDGSYDDIYYTVNDGIPDENSILYGGEIVLDEVGTYAVKAVAVNEYGIRSVVAQGEYVIEKSAPAAPEIMEPSGEYNQNTMIVAVAEAGCTIFYTTDGSDPTMDSKQYVSPITMPVGSSHYRFIAYDDDGDFSEIVDREYHLVFSRLVSAEQAVSTLVSTLVRLNLLLDASGNVAGIDGHYEYLYNSIIEIEGAGEYYVILEYHAFNDGTSGPTGLMYAVNTHDGAVNRLGYDTSGKYTLIKISNR